MIGPGGDKNSGKFFEAGKLLEISTGRVVITVLDQIKDLPFLASEI